MTVDVPVNGCRSRPSVSLCVSCLCDRLIYPLTASLALWLFFASPDDLFPVPHPSSFATATRLSFPHLVLLMQTDDPLPFLWVLYLKALQAIKH